MKKPSLLSHLFSWAIAITIFIHAIVQVVNNDLDGLVMTGLALLGWIYVIEYEQRLTKS